MTCRPKTLVSALWRGLGTKPSGRALSFHESTHPSVRALEQVERHALAGHLTQSYP